MISRAMKIQVFCPPDKLQAVIDSIRKYRAAARKMFALAALAEISGSEIDEKKGTVLPVSDNSKKLLSLAMNKEGKAHLYEMRDFIRTEYAPEWLSFVWDSLRADVSNRWRAKDPEFPKATRGYLIDQGARSLGFFQRIGIGFPQATGRPKIEGHTITLKWAHDIGEVAFQVGRLDAGRHYHFKCLSEKLEEYKPGTVFLTEHEGKLFVSLTYSMPEKTKALVPDRVMELRFGTAPEQFMLFSGQTISAAGIIAQLGRLKNQSLAYKDELAAHGNPRKSWGNKRAYESTSKKLNNVTMQRTATAKNQNHLWARRIVDEAIRNEAGILKVSDLPKKEIFGYPWDFSQLKSFLEYKMTEVGGKVIFEN